MNTKISEEQIKKTHTPKVDKAIMPGPTYFVILGVTVVLLLSFLIAFLRFSQGNQATIMI